MNVDLRALRINRGLGVEEAAEQMGVNRNTLTRVERGEQRPHAATAYRIASFYGLQVTDIWPVEAAA